MIVDKYSKGGGGGSGSTVSWLQQLTAGTQIAQININGRAQNVYAPAGGGSGASDLVVVDSLDEIESPVEGMFAYVKKTDFDCVNLSFNRSTILEDSQPIKIDVGIPDKPIYLYVFKEEDTVRYLISLFNDYDRSNQYVMFSEGETGWHKFIDICFDDIYDEFFCVKLEEDGSITIGINSMALGIVSVDTSEFEGEVTTAETAYTLDCRNTFFYQYVDEEWVVRRRKYLEIGYPNLYTNDDFNGIKFTNINAGNGISITEDWSGIHINATGGGSGGTVNPAGNSVTPVFINENGEAVPVTKYSWVSGITNNFVPYVRNDSVCEIGEMIDFHYLIKANDFDYRLKIDANGKLVGRRFNDDLHYIVEGTNVASIWKGTQAEYDAIAVKDNNTFYIIT